MRDVITVLVGTSQASESLRRSVAQCGKLSLGVGAQLRGLRRWLHDPSNAAVICVTLDECTLTRHAEPLRTLLADLAGLPGAIGSIGLLGPEGLTPEHAAVGCDLYVDSTCTAVEMIEELARLGASDASGRVAQFMTHAETCRVAVGDHDLR